MPSKHTTHRKELHKTSLLLKVNNLTYILILVSLLYILSVVLLFDYKLNFNMPLEWYLLIVDGVTGKVLFKTDSTSFDLKFSLTTQAWLLFNAIKVLMYLASVSVYCCYYYSNSHTLCICSCFYCMQCWN